MIVKNLDITAKSTINKTQEEINSGVFQARISVYQSMDYTLNNVKENTVLSSCMFIGCCTFCAHQVSAVGKNTCLCN